MTKWYNFHKDDGACIIMGNGRSITEQKFKTHWRNYPWFGVNEIARAVTPDYVVIQDDPVGFKKNDPDLIALRDSWEKCEMFLMNNKEKWMDVHPRILGIEKTNWMIYLARSWLGHPFHDMDRYKDMIARWGEEHTMIPLFPYPQSAQMATLLAMYMGIRRVGILGIDYTPGHFYGSGVHYSKGAVGLSDKGWSKTYEMVTDIFGGSMVNLSEQSLIESIPKGDI